MKNSSKSETAWGGSINDWSDATRKAGKSTLADQLVENEEVKFAGRETLKKLELPHFKKIDPTPVPHFLEDPQKYFQQLEISEYHVSLLSEIENKRRLRLGYLNQQQVLDFIRANVSPDEEDKFTILLGEIKKNIYAGNIISGKDGSLLLEAAGPNIDHIDLVTGKVTPEFFAERSRPGEEIEYYFRRGTHHFAIEPVSLEIGLRETLEAIPRNFTTSSGRQVLYPGYYEFVLIHKGDDSADLTPIFIDYRDKNIYQMNR